MPLISCRSGDDSNFMERSRMTWKRQKITYMKSCPSDPETPLTEETQDPLTSNTTRPLPNLPLEMINEIFTHLTPISSTCLGLTCKNFYAIHKKTYPASVGLHEIESIPSENNWWLGDSMVIIRSLPHPPTQTNITLGQLLTTWIGPEFYLHRIVKCPLHCEDFHVVAAGIRSAIFLRKEDPNKKVVFKGGLGMLVKKLGELFGKERERREEEERERMGRHLRLIPRNPQPRYPRVVKRNFPRRIRN